MAAELRPVNARQQAYARTYARTHDKGYAASVAGYVNPPIHNHAIEAEIRAEMMRDLRDLRPAAIGVLKRALDPKMDIRHALTGLGKFVDMVKAFGGDTGDAPDADLAEMSGAALQRAISALVDKERALIDVTPASPDVIDDAEPITEIDPFA